MWTVIVRDATGKLHSTTQLKAGVVTIGRSIDCDIVLLSAAVSRLHGRLLVTGSNMLIYSDEGSGNGSFVQGQPVVGAVDVGHAGVISIGEFQLTLELADAATPKAAHHSTLVLKPNELELIAQAPPKPTAATPKPASAPPSVPVPEATIKPAAPAVLKSALPGFEFKDLDTLGAPPPTPAKPAITSESIASLLEQQIQGIQSHRNKQEQNQRTRKEEFEQQWRDAVTAARDLQAKLRGDARVLYYVISRDGQEISVKISDNSKRGYTNFTLSHRHPETLRHDESSVWFSEFGDEPKAYREPKDALEDFVRRIASKLA